MYKFDLPEEINRLLNEEPKPIKNYLSAKKAEDYKVLNFPALYIFWWMGDRGIIENKNMKIVLQGAKITDSVEYKQITVHWTFPDGNKPFALYVGKTTNLKSRISQHLRLKSQNHQWEEKYGDNKLKPSTTSCQLRHGLDHLFRATTTEITEILDHVGITFLETGENDQDVVNRFYNEDLLIGLLRPWFNIDSER